jgi:hypothetical protein
MPTISSSSGYSKNLEGDEMESSIGPLDIAAFVVFALLICAAVIIVVNVGKLPGELARKWGHPQAAAIGAMGWVGMATGGLLWPIALIWAFTTPFGARPSVENNRQPRGLETEATTGATSLRKPSGDKETRS